MQQPFLWNKTWHQFIMLTACRTENLHIMNVSCTCCNKSLRLNLIITSLWRYATLFTWYGYIHITYLLMREQKKKESFSSSPFFESAIFADAPKQLNFSATIFEITEMKKSEKPKEHIHRYNGHCQRHKSGMEVLVLSSCINQKWPGWQWRY